MSEYDMALDCQIDWASFWSSDSGRSLKGERARTFEKTIAAERAMSLE